MQLQCWEHPGKRRYYQTLVQQNLLGQWELLRIWGGVGSARGGQQCVPVPDEAAANVALATAVKHRAKRGYLPVLAGPR